ncbi:hypothetical protein WN48_00244 [Eufriesea mexicana]|uniref:Uncharacterized protein n=1 Tax=Eufriesea mexicana TaxID=516756 RepID=A0A310S5I4_9HYME|nr:hypothetical protein WN48_00244 [Eufriesea mexicana]
MCSSRGDSTRAGQRGQDDERRNVCVLWKRRKKEKEEEEDEEGKESERKNLGSGEKRLRYPQSPKSSPIPSHPIPSHPIPSHPIPSHPIPSFRCPRVCHAVRLNAKGPTEREQKVTERAGKGKIRSQQQAGGKTKNRPAYIELACDDDDDDDRDCGGGGGGGCDDDDEGGTHT